MNDPYTDEEIDVLIDMFYRDHPRPTPFPAIASAMGRAGCASGLDELLWKVVTGYSGNSATGARRAIIKRSPRRYNYRAGLPWYPRECEALRLSLEGEGLRREPPCDVRYISLVLARSCEEVQERWEMINKDPLGRAGFGLGGGE